MSKKRLKPDLSWLTDDIVIRINHIRNRAGQEDLTREQWEKAMLNWDQKAIDGVRWYCNR